MEFLRIFLASVVVAGVAAQDTCNPNAVVGHCVVTGCFEWKHGPAYCDGFHCFCESGFCSRDQRTCVPITATTTTRTTTTNTTTTTTRTTTTSTTTTPGCHPAAVVGHCVVTGCWYTKYGWAHCHDGQCICDAGYCSTDGLTCIAENTYTLMNEKNSGEDTSSLSESLVQGQGVPIWLYVAWVAAGATATLVLVCLVGRRRERHQLAEHLLHGH